jgi:MFS family permease
MDNGWPTVTRSRVALLAGLAVDNVGSGLFLPLAVLYATREVGVSVDAAGAVIAAASVLGFAVPPIAGRLTHRLGPRAVVVAAQLVQGAGATAYLLAEGVVGLFVAAGLMAVGIQLFYCSVFVLIADMSTAEAKERPFALVAMVRAGAFGLGNLAGALALAWDSERALRILVGVDAATFAVAAAVLALFVFAPPAQHADVRTVGVRSVLRDRRYLSLIVATCLVGLSVDFALVGTPVYLLDVVDGPAWLPGALLAMGTALSSVLGVRVVDALSGFRRSRSLQAGALLFALWASAMVAIEWLPSAAVVAYAVGCWLLLVAGAKVFFPVSGALSEALPPRASRAVYMATFQYAFTAAQVLAPAVVGLFAVASWLPWAVVAGAALTGVPVLGWLGRVIPPDQERRRPPIAAADGQSAAPSNTS